MSRPSSEVRIPAAPVAPVRVRAAVITCSDSAARGAAVDTSGPLASQLLADLGHEVAGVSVLADDAGAIVGAVRQAISAGARVVVTTGGTGAGPRDVTPEALRSMGLRELPGLGEAIRAASRSTIPAADLSRALGGILDDAVVLALPGSPGGVRDGLAAVGGLLEHAAAMARGVGHPGRRPPASPPTGTGDDDPGSQIVGIVRPRPGEVPRHETHVDSGAGLVEAAPIIESEVAAQVSRATAGAVVTFAGVVRDHDRGAVVTALHYEGHPDAGRILAEVVAEALDRPGVLAAAARHRTGDLAVGDLAFVAAVSAAHRREAFDACAWLVDETKARLPIWKHQHFADGTDEWVNSP
jgi:molybdenum cofactor synthesis domain-containing protein